MSANRWWWWWWCCCATKATKERRQTTYKQEADLPPRRTRNPRQIFACTSPRWPEAPVAPWPPTSRKIAWLLIPRESTVQHREPTGRRQGDAAQIPATQTRAPSPGNDSTTIRTAKAISRRTMTGEQRWKGAHVNSGTRSGINRVLLRKAEAYSSTVERVVTARTEPRRRRTTTDAWPSIGRIPANGGEGRWGLREVAYIDRTTPLSLFLSHQLRLPRRVSGSKIRASAWYTAPVNTSTCSLGSPSRYCQRVDERKKGRGEFGRRAPRRNPVSCVGYTDQKASGPTWQDFLSPSFFLFYRFFFLSRLLSSRIRIRLELFWRMILNHESSYTSWHLLTLLDVYYVRWCFIVCRLHLDFGRIRLRLSKNFENFTILSRDRGKIEVQ